MADLSQIASSFARSRITPNPAVDDYSSRINGFCMQLKLDGHRLDDWDDDDWFLAMDRLGIPEIHQGGLMENIASWGVDD
jgi:hypothetical protein